MQKEQIASLIKKILVKYKKSEFYSHRRMERVVDKLGKIFNLRWQARWNLKRMLELAGADTSDEGISYFMDLMYITGNRSELPKRVSRHVRKKRAPNFQAMILDNTYTDEVRDMWH